MRSWSQGLLILLAMALAGAGGAGLVLWLQGRKPAPAPQVQMPVRAPTEPAPAAQPEAATKADPSSEDSIAKALMEGRPLQLASGAPISNDGSKSLLPGNHASETDRLREEGTRRYTAQLASLAHSADQMELAFTRFLASYWDGRVVGTFDRSFYALWENGALQGGPVRGYEYKVGELRQAADQLRRHLQEMEDQARRDGVFPGTRRELRQRYRLNHRGWD